jgi:hypothetical protein
MATSPVQVERRVGQRFPFLLPVSLRDPSSGLEGLGFTQDLSSRGIFFFTDAALHEGAEIELTLNMPSEITLGESMRVRCRGRILRVVKRSDPGLPEVPAQSETQVGVAVRFDGYEYLSESADVAATFQRVASLHSHSEEERPVRRPVHAPPVPS